MTTCQICAREIKAPKGLIAHHGYKRPGDHYQTASCIGARFAPYETAADRIPYAIDRLRSFIQNKENQLHELLFFPPAILIGQVYKGSGHYESINVFRPDGFNQNSARTFVPNAYDTLYYGRLSETKSAIKYAKIDLDFLTKRLADWKPPK